MCEKLLAQASPLELFGEEIDPETGRHLGNFPQAFTHLALINAVMHVIHAEARHAEKTVRRPLSPPEDRAAQPEEKRATRPALQRRNGHPSDSGGS